MGEPENSGLRSTQLYTPLAFGRNYGNGSMHYRKLTAESEPSQPFAYPGTWVEIDELCFLVESPVGLPQPEETF